VSPGNPSVVWDQLLKIRVSSAAKADLNWWCTGLDIVHEIAPFTSDEVLPSHHFSSDSVWVLPSSG
jgi:hypothetical protein